MQLLLDERKTIIAIGKKLEYGVWGNLDDGIASWKISESSYCMDNNFTVVDVEDDAIPVYVQPTKYVYSNGEFKLIDECPNEYRDKITENTEAIVTIEDAMCESELYSDERLAAIEDALCELSTLLEI